MKQLRLNIANFLNRDNKYCWFGLVSFYLHNHWYEIFNPGGESCRTESEGGCEACYCGKFVKGKRFKRITK